MKQKKIKIGKRLKPNAKKIFKNEKTARITKARVDFYGADLEVDVHNAYETRFLGKKSKIAIAADRSVRLKERGIECWIDQRLIRIKMRQGNKKKRGILYGGFPWELKQEQLKRFPIIFEYDKDGRLQQLTILSVEAGKKKH